MFLKRDITVILFVDIIIFHMYVNIATAKINKFNKKSENKIEMFIKIKIALSRFANISARILKYKIFKYIFLHVFFK